ncbi:MAG: hypothetical protein ACRENS_09605, partial [Candidatus Eiseniibacteriota bacterium]
MLTLPVLAIAQTSRVEGMALQGDYIKDYTGIYSYPSAITGVGNLMYGEFGVSGGGTPGDRSVGGVMDKLFDGRWGTWGLHLRQLTPALGQGDFTSSPSPGTFTGSDPNFNANEGFDVMWGRKTSTTSLGLRINRSYASFQDQLPGVTTKLQFDPGAASNNLGRNIMGYGAGVGFQMNPQTDVELAALLQLRSYENSTTAVQKNTDNGSTTYQLAARAFMHWKPNVMLVPVVKFSSFDLSEKLDATPGGGALTQFDNSLTGWQLGISSDWTMGTNDLVVWGVTFAQNKIDEEEDLFGLVGANNHAVITESLMPQLFAALETHVNNWLTLRFGANKGAFQ